ncbi:hypothetical protein GCM10027422_34550 [Hymenobacter arcticus]
MGRKAVLFLVATAALFGIGFFLMSKHLEKFHDSIRSHRKMYCYDLSRGAPSATLYITDLNDSAAYIKYYHAIENRQNPAIEFPLNGLTSDSPVYVQKYINADSSLAEVVSYYQSPIKSRPFYLRCYVYGPTLHISPLVHNPK